MCGWGKVMCYNMYDIERMNFFFNKILVCVNESKQNGSEVKVKVCINQQLQLFIKIRTYFEM